MATLQQLDMNILLWIQEHLRVDALTPFWKMCIRDRCYGIFLNYDNSLQQNKNTMFDDKMCIRDR